MRALKKLAAFLSQGWVLSILFFIAISLLIWFIGPLFAFAGRVPLLSVNNRVIAILIFAIFCIFKLLFTHWRNKKRDALIMASMVEDTGPSIEDQATEEELKHLKTRLEKSLGILKNAKLGKKSGRRFLYQLPWYILIGPPGAGKTTLLQNSSLKFPLSDANGKEAIKGVGGTRNCDWWFAEDAVLLDTAGRYTTQDSNREVDSRSWLGFLDLLKTHRKRRPLNGVIVSVSLNELMQMSSAEYLEHAANIRNRLHELQERLGIRFPVYMVFTKADLISGFMEYFDDLNAEHRSQIWGMTFDYDENPEQNAIDTFEHEFELLTGRLDDLLIQKLERERNAERRKAIYGFPTQFAALQQPLSEFLNEVFQASRYQHATMIRGVYLTSATQEGSPIDRMMGALAQQYQVATQKLSGLSGSGKSFFINKLLNNVIFQESELAGTNIKLERKRNWLQGIALTALLGLSLLFSLGWLYSYNKNAKYVEGVSTATEMLTISSSGLANSNDDVLATLPTLNIARNVPGGVEIARPGGLQLGLDQSDKLGDIASSKYTTLLDKAFLPRVMARVEVLLQNNLDNPDYLFETLKVYLMLADQEHYDAETVRAWIGLDWDNNLPIDTTLDDREALVEHLNALTEEQPDTSEYPLRKQLITRARNALATVPLSSRVYARLKLDQSSSDIEDFRISNAAGRDAPLVFIRKSGEPLNRGVAGFYTYRGYQDYFLPQNDLISKRIAQESWVLGEDYQLMADGDDLELLKEDVLKLYLEEFAREWETLIADIGIVSFANLDQAVEVLNILTGDNSPLRKLLTAIQKETDLAQVDTAEEQEDEATDVASQLESTATRKIQNKVSQLARRVPGARALHRARVTADYVGNRFDGLNSMVKSEDGGPAPIDRTLELLSELYLYLNSLSRATGDQVMLSARDNVNNVLQKVRTETKRQPYPINKMLEGIVNSTSSMVSGDVCEHINSAWQSDVQQFCDIAINKRYPILKTDKEIAQEDFGVMFSNGGKIHTFFDKYLADAVDTTGSDWKWIQRDDEPSCVSDASLQQFKYAKVIRETFFRFGGQLPAMSFSLKPVSMSAEITQLSLNIDGTELKYAHGPVNTTPMKWPGPNNSGTIRMTLNPPIAGTNSGLQLEGPWALFRLFDQGEITRVGNSEKYILKLNLSGREIVFELRANSTLNPINLTELSQFACPPIL